MNAESRPRLASERRIYLAAAIAATALILIGFARTYYLKFLYDAPAITPLVHLHGFVMTVWFGLFLAQVVLVSKRRVDLHRRLGMFGALWAPIVFVVAVATAIAAAKAGHAPPGPPPLVFLAVPLGDLSAVAIFGAEGFVTLPWLLFSRMGSYRTTDAAGIALLLGAICLLLALPSTAGDKNTRQAHG